jgi:tetratricopeptide (TPR) repeat protein
MVLRSAVKSNVLTLPGNPQGRVAVCCELACRHEDRGDYDAGVEALKSYWRGPGTRPDTSELESGAAAAVLLRAGSLTAWLGTKRQVEGWQELAKDLLSESASYCLDEPLWLETQKHLSLCYWRVGSFSEARVVAKAALQKADPASEVGIMLNLTLALIERSDKHYDEALKIHLAVAGLVEQSESQLLKGRFYNGLALTRKAIGAIDKAIGDMSTACRHFEAVGHRPNLIAADINLANLLVQNKQLNEAHRHLDRAEELSRELGDAVHLAQAKDSRALAFLAERNCVAAEAAARQSVNIIEKGDEWALLVESVLTHARALVGCHRTGDAMKAYLRAYDVAALRISGERSSAIGLEMVTQIAGELSLEAHVPFDEITHKFQESILKAAMDGAEGKVTEAALRLGMSHQNLLWLLNNRYTHLRHKPPRRRSVIRASAKAERPR